MRRPFGILMLTLALALSIPISARSGDVREGLASYYASSLDGSMTASGGRFDNDAMVAAHPTHPFGTVVRVTNLRNGRSVTVRIVDRGPARGPRKDGVIIDVSRAAAEALGFLQRGHTRVTVEVLSLGRAPARQGARLSR